MEFINSTLQYQSLFLHLLNANVKLQWLQATATRTTLNSSQQLDCSTNARKQLLNDDNNDGQGFSLFMPLYYHTVVWILCYGITMLSDYHTTVLIPCYRITVLSDHHTTMLSNYRAVVLPHSRTNTVLSNYRAIWSPYSRAIELPCCRITKLSDYHTTVLILCYRTTVLSQQRSAQIKEPCAHVASERYVCN